MDADHYAASTDEPQFDDIVDEINQLPPEPGETSGTRIRTTVQRLFPESEDAIPSAKALGSAFAVCGWLYVLVGIIVVAAAAVVFFAGAQGNPVNLVTVIPGALGGFLLVLAGAILIAFKGWLVGVTTILYRTMLAAERV